MIENFQRLNKKFLGIDASTDVLSFPGGDKDPDTGNQYLGILSSHILMFSPNLRSMLGVNPMNYNY